MKGMAIPKSRLIIMGAAAFVVLLGLLVFFGVIPGLRDNSGNRTITLSVWGVAPEETINRITGTLGKNYQITYRPFAPARYETELLDALASGRGPDVFMIHSSWLPKHFNKLIPVSEEQLSLKAFKALYPTVVAQDFAPDGFIYALPLSLDTLALLYNRDMFDSAGVATPPKNWKEFEEAVKKLRRLDASGRLVRAGAAIGGSGKSIIHEADLLSALMLQGGTPMVAPDFSRATFAAQGGDALTFYTKFANPVSDVYTWNDNSRDSLESLANEFAAMAFGYAADLPGIREKNPSLPLEVAPLPQPVASETSVGYASYWGLAVSNRARAPADAWGLILTLTAIPANARLYSETAGLPPALRSLIAEKTNDPVLGVFTEQTLIARSWPQADPAKVAEIFSNMVEDVLAGRAIPAVAIRGAEEAVTALMKKR